jgi:hypothetical protein
MIGLEDGDELLFFAGGFRAPAGGNQHRCQN